MDNRSDKATKAMLFEGASVSQLGILFSMDNRTIAGKIHGVSPCAKRAAHPVYAIKDVAPFLCKPAGDIEEYIRKMNHRDLPPMLLKEFWAGQMTKQKFEENEGDLWRTDKVIEHYSETFKTMRMSILLMLDRLERDTDVTERQRIFFRSLIDGVLSDLHDNLIEKFKDEPDRAISGAETIREIPEEDDRSEGL